jgi:hypothetical protein
VERMWASDGRDVTWGWFAMLMAILAVSLGVKNSLIAGILVLHGR